MAVVSQASSVRRSGAPAQPLDDDWRSWAVIGAIVGVSTLSLWVPAIVLALG
jgi:hypothetical protein